MIKLRKLTILFVAALFFGLFAATAPMDVQANTLPAPQNVRVETGNVLRWDAVPGATSYFVTMHSGDLTLGLLYNTWSLATEASNAFVNLQEDFDIATMLNHGEAVRFIVVARFANTEETSSAYIDWAKPAVQPPQQQLFSPTGLRVDTSNVLRWDSVAHATRYIVAFRINDSHGTRGSFAFTTSSFLDLRSNPWISGNLDPGQTIQFAIGAFGPGFSSSPRTLLEWTVPGGGVTPPDTWHADVRQSWSLTPGGGNFSAGQTVSINAGHRHNHFFIGWASSHNVWLTNPFSPSTTFTMPAANVHVTAIWVHADQWTGWDWPDGTWPDWWWQNQWPDGQVPDWWWGQQWPDGQIPDWWWNQQWPGGQMPDWWWQNQWPGTNPPPDWWWQQWPGGQLPHWQRPGTNVTANWQVQQRGGVSFNYGDGNFPETLAVSQGSNVTFQLRVDRHLASFNANFVGQWLRNGQTHGSAFPITLSSAGFADIDLNIASLASGNAGDYSLRVATVVNGTTTHVDTSRVAALSISGQGQAIIWPLQPELPDLPDVNPMPTPRPNLHVQPATSISTGMAALISTPIHNHNLVEANLDTGSTVLQILPGTNEVRLYGKTLDAMIDSNTTLFVVNDLVWAIMPPNFLAHLRELGGNFIGPNGGTFNISIRETHGGQTLVTAQIGITTTLNGTTRALTGLTVPYALAIELWDFGVATANPQHIAVLHEGIRLPGHVNTETGVLSVNVMATGDFGVNYIIE